MKFVILDATRVPGREENVMFEIPLDASDNFFLECVCDHIRLKAKSMGPLEKKARRALAALTPDSIQFSGVKGGR